MYKKICLHCKEPFVSKTSYRKYCGDLCRSRQGMINNGTNAKPFKCQNCGKLFKRRSAKNTKCQECRTSLTFGAKLAVNFIDVPVTDRETELQMQQDWLKTNKATVA